jgi:MerR family regulatory protein
MDYSIGKVAKMNNMTILQLHYYNRQGLLPFIKRTVLKYRVSSRISSVHFLLFYYHSCQKPRNSPSVERSVPLYEGRTFSLVGW